MITPPRHSLKLGTSFRNRNALKIPYTGSSPDKIPAILTFTVRSPLINKEVQEQAKVLLKKMGLEDKADAYPYQLSGGQQQRVSIARALCMNPKILFFDEPTSALDPQLTGEILKVIKDLAAEHMTMVIVTHEMNFARNVADHIVFMENGVIVKEGAPEELFTSDNQRIKEFLGKFQD